MSPAGRQANQITFFLLLACSDINKWTLIIESVQFDEGGCVDE